MSNFEDHDYILVPVGNNCDSTNNDNDVIIIEDSEIEITDDMLTVQPTFEGLSDNYQQPSRKSYGAEGLGVHGGQAVLQMNQPANLERYIPNSVEFIPLNKNERPCTVKEKNADLEELVQTANSQGNSSPSIPVGRKETHAWANTVGTSLAQTNPVGTSLPSAACLELQQPDHRKSPPLSKIVSSYSLQHYFTQGIPFPQIAMLPYSFNKGAGSTENAISSAQAAIAIPVAVLPKGETNPANNPDMVNYSALVENDSRNPAVTSSSFCIPPNLEMPGKAEISLENSTETVHYPTLLENKSGQDIASPFVSIPPNSGMPERAETSLENNSDAMNYPPFFVHGSGQCSSTSSNCIPPNVVSEKVMLIEMPGIAGISLENNSQRRIYPMFFVDNNGPVTTFSPLSIPSNFESRPEMSSETMNYPILMGNNSGPDNDSASRFLPPSYGYLGDPKRNVKILNTHLVAAQKKTEPKHAARYLIGVLFSKEVLIYSSVGANSLGYYHLDPNKMAAVREFLAAVFPDYDLSECGKDWKACESNISALICRLRFEAKRMIQKTVHKDKKPTTPNTPRSADLNDESVGDGSEGSSQLSQGMSASETRENRNSQQASNAICERMEGPSNEILECFGNPCRNIQMPRSVLDIAKGKPCPELSAKYLIRNLFSEEVLVKSNVYGSMGHGLCALNSNRINALREFLQDIYPTRDLSESGYGWKLCVTAMNSCIRSIRYQFKKSTGKLTESEPRDTNLTD